MGGQNHQPCNKPGTSYLKFSTQMSLECSNARMAFEFSNVQLEQVLLQELGVPDVQASSAATIREFLGQSLDALERMYQAASALRAEMVANDFKDLPELKRVDLLRLGARMVESGLVDSRAWDVISETMDSSLGFYGVLDLFENHLVHLRLLTANLHDAFASGEMRRVVRCGELNQVLETNLEGNVKVEFARLYTAWHWFQQLFLASSMLSTELWYQHQHVGSLLDQKERQEVA